MGVHRTEVAGDELVWDDDGPEDGPTLVLCHGAGYDASTFDAVTAALVDGGCRVLRPDVRGAGRSTDRSDRISEGPSRLTADLLAVLDAAGARDVSLLGHSMGGWPALGAALARPALVRRLVLVATPAGIFTPVVATFWEAFEARLVDGAPPAAVAAVRSLRATAPSLDAVAALDCEVGFVYGAEDPVYPPTVLAAAAAAIPAATVTVVPGAGHHLHHSHPEVIVAALR